MIGFFSLFAGPVFVVFVSLGAQASPALPSDCIVPANADSGRPADWKVSLTKNSGGKYAISVNGISVANDMAETTVSEHGPIDLTLGYLMMSVKDVASMSAIVGSAKGQEIKFFAFWSDSQKLLARALLLGGAFGGECK